MTNCLLQAQYQSSHPWKSGYLSIFLLHWILTISQSTIYYSPKIFWNWFNIQMPKHVNTGSLPPDINVLHSYQWYTNTIIDIATLTDHVKTLHTKISNIFALVFIFWKTWHFLFCRLKRASHTVIASQWKIHLKWSALQFLNFSIPESTHKESSVVTLCLASLPSDSTLCILPISSVSYTSTPALQILDNLHRTLPVFIHRCRFYFATAKLLNKH